MYNVHQHKPFKRSVECSVHCVVWVSFLSKVGWKGLMTCLIKILFFLRDYWTKSDRVFAEMQIISYNFIILKHIQINAQFRKILMLKIRLSRYWGQSVLCKKKKKHDVLSKKIFVTDVTPWVVTSVITSFGVNIEWTGRNSTRWVGNFHSILELESSEIHSSTNEVSSLHRWSELFTRFFF